MVLTFDYRQRLSLRKYQDCGTSPAQSVSNHPSLSHLQIFATHELSKVFHLTFRGGKIRQGFDTICAGAVQARKKEPCHADVSSTRQGSIFSGDLLSQHFFHKLRDIFCQCHTDIAHAMIAVESDLLLHSHCIVFFQAVPQRHYHMFARCDIISTSNYDTHIPILHIFKGICKAIRFFMCIRILVDGFQSVTLKNTSFLYQSPEPFPLPMKQIIGRIIGGASG